MPFSSRPKRPGLPLEGRRRTIFFSFTTKKGRACGRYGGSTVRISSFVGHYTGSRTKSLLSPFYLAIQGLSTYGLLAAPFSFHEKRDEYLPPPPTQQQTDVGRPQKEGILRSIYHVHFSKFGHRFPLQNPRTVFQETLSHTKCSRSPSLKGRRWKSARRKIPRWSMGFINSKIPGQKIMERTRLFCAAPRWR